MARSRAIVPRGTSGNASGRTTTRIPVISSACPPLQFEGPKGHCPSIGSLRLSWSDQSWTALTSRGLPFDACRQTHFARAHAQLLAHDASEVRAALEAAFQRHLGHVEVGVLQEPARTLQAQPL